MFVLAFSMCILNLQYLFYLVQQVENKYIRLEFFFAVFTLF